MMLAFAISPQIAIAESDSDHDHDHDDHKHEQEAHVHGLAELTLALEGNILEISFESPSANIVGFEYKAKTDEQIAAVKNAKSILESPNKLFTFNGTTCSIKGASADVSALLSGNDHSDHDDNKDEHEHDKHDDHSDHDEHKDGHEHDMHDDHSDDGKAAHSEVDASYQFSCANGSQLQAISVNLIDLFPAIEKIKAMWVTDTKQGGSEVKASSKLITIR